MQKCLKYENRSGIVGIFPLGATEKIAIPNFRRQTVSDIKIDRFHIKNALLIEFFDVK